jgi:CheY-like chemotaxis protein
MTKFKRILLVEDNQNDVELTLALDYIYHRAKYSDRAKGLPCVILLDLKMPRVDGLEVLRQLKSDPVLCHIPVVMLTSSREEKDLIPSYDLGVNAFVVKPVNFDRFLEAIRALGVFWAIVNEAPPPRHGFRQSAC